MQLQHITCGPCQKTKGIEKGIGKILQGEGGRNSKSCMKCLLQLIYDRSISIYMKWVKTFECWMMVLSHVVSIGFLKTEVRYVDFGEATAK